MAALEDCPLHAAAPELCDEAAAQIAHFLIDLALCFENTYFAQIRRRHQTMRPIPDPDTAANFHQLELFGDLELF